MAPGSLHSASRSSRCLNNFSEFFIEITSSRIVALPLACQRAVEITTRDIDAFIGSFNNLRVLWAGKNLRPPFPVCSRLFYFISFPILFFSLSFNFPFLRFFSFLYYSLFLFFDFHFLVFVFFRLSGSVYLLFPFLLFFCSRYTFCS